MLGCIIGDIAGSTCEFDEFKSKDFPLFFKGSEYTDDSIMALAVASALIKGREEGKGQPQRPLRELMVEVYREQYGKDPKIEAIHAGLECGLFAGKLPGLDCVSIGPDLTEIHTTREKMHISSVRRVWEMTVEVLRRMK